MRPKFSKALLAAGLAAALVGCGGGSSNQSIGAGTGGGGGGGSTTVTLTPVPLSVPKAESFTLQPGTSQDLRSGDHYVVCAAGGPACEVTVTVANGVANVSYTGGTLTAYTTPAGDQKIADNDPETGLLATEKKKLEALDMQAYTAINTRRNYNGTTNPKAATAVDALQKAVTDSKYISDEDKTKYNNMITRYRDVIAANVSPERLLDGLDKWNARITGVDSLDSTTVGTTTGNIHITDMYGERTNIRVTGLSAGTNITPYEASKIGPVWKGQDFQTAHQSPTRSLKVFTTHEAGTSQLATTTWGQFWGSSGNGDHYGESAIFGTGSPYVSFSAPATGSTLSGLTFAANTALIAIGNVHQTVPQTAADTTKAKMIIPEYKPVVTKVHMNDVEIFRGPGNPVKLTKTPLVLDSRDLGAVDNNHSKFLGQPGGFGCVTGGTNSTETLCGLSVNDDGFIVLTLHRDDNGTALAQSTSERVILEFQSEKEHSSLISNTIGFDRADNTYMTMGYWLKADGTAIDTFAKARYWYDDRTGVNTYGLTADANGNANLGQVKGTATYTGQATGAYVLNTPEPNNNLDLILHRGEFRADAMLNASFGSTASSTDGGFKVSGEVKNFSSLTDSNHTAAMQSNFGTLSLNRTDTNNPGGSFRGSTTGNGVTTTNAWQGQFYGNTGRETLTAADNFPDAAVGEFKGDFGNENKVVGVFGVD